MLDDNTYVSQRPRPISLVRVYDTSTFTKVLDASLPRIVAGCVFGANGTHLFCDMDERVVVFDPATLDGLTAIPAAVNSLAASPSGDRLYLGQQDGSVTVYDSATYDLLATVPLPSAPGPLAVTPDGSHIYVALARSVAAIATATNTVVGEVGGVSSGSSFPSDLTFAKGQVYVVVGGGSLSEEDVTVIDAATGTIVTRIPLDFPLEIAASQDESRVFVTGGDFGLSTIDTASLQIVHAPDVPKGPGRLSLSPLTAVAQIVVDTPVLGARVEQPFAIRGWAAEVFGVAGTTGVDAVHVWAFPAAGGSPTFLGAAEYGRPRPDVAAVFGADYTNAGFELTVRGLPPGAYTLTAFGHAIRTGTFSVAREVPVVVASSLRMAVDAPAPGASVSGSFVVAGWVLDGTAASGAGIDAVHVWAYPTSGAPPAFLGAATLGISRPDVAAAFGAQFGASGFALPVADLGAGTYTLIVYAHQASTGTFAIERAVRVAVTAPQPITVIDVPAAGAAVGTGVRVAGWALELGAASGTGVDAVHVWAYPASGGAPMLIGVAQYGIVRSDVGAIFGNRYGPSGFDVTGTLPSGRYTIVAFAHSSTSHAFRGTQSVVVTVQ